MLHESCIEVKYEYLLLVVKFGMNLLSFGLFFVPDFHQVAKRTLDIELTATSAAAACSWLMILYLFLKGELQTPTPFSRFVAYMYYVYIYIYTISIHINSKSLNLSFKSIQPWQIHSSKKGKHGVDLSIIIQAAALAVLIDHPPEKLDCGDSVAVKSNDWRCEQTKQTSKNQQLFTPRFLFFRHHLLLNTRQGWIIYVFIWWHTFCRKVRFLHTTLERDAKLLTAGEMWLDLPEQREVVVLHPFNNWLKEHPKTWHPSSPVFLMDPGSWALDPTSCRSTSVAGRPPDRGQKLQLWQLQCFDGPWHVHLKWYSWLQKLCPGSTW